MGLRGLYVEAERLNIDLPFNVLVDPRWNCVTALCRCGRGCGLPRGILFLLGYGEGVEGEEEGHQARQAEGQIGEDEEDAYGLAGVGSGDGRQRREAPLAEEVEEDSDEGEKDTPRTIP